MNLTDLLSSAAGGQGFDALARQFWISADQARSVAGAALPALSSGMKRMAGSPDGLQAMAGMIRSNDAAEIAEAPEANPAAAGAEGTKFFETLFGEARPDIEQEIASDAAGRAGVDQSTAAAMLPMIASMVLGMMQKTESNDSGLNAVVGQLLEGGGADQGGGLGGLVGGLMGALGGGGASADSGGLGGLMSMLDADGDGSVADDLLDRFMKR